MSDKLHPQPKVYKIVLGSFKDTEFEDYSNIASITVIAEDVHSAIDKAGDWILQEEKKAKKNKEGIFIEEVVVGNTIDLV